MKRHPEGMSLLLAALTLGLLLAASGAPATAGPIVQRYTATSPTGIEIQSAPPGTSILVLGYNLGRSGTVAFRGVPAEAVSWSPEEIQVTVPTPPSYPFKGAVTVTTNGETGYGPEFTITSPAGEPPAPPQPPEPPAPPPAPRVPLPRPPVTPAPTLVLQVGHGGGIRSLAYSPDGKTLATGGSYPDATVRLWDVGSWLLKSVLPVGGSGLHTVAFALDGQTLATVQASMYGASTGPAQLWDVTSGQPRSHPGEMWGPIAFSPDGKTLATRGEEGVQLWDVASGKVRVTLDSWWPFVFSPDGTILAAESGLWDVSSGQLKATLQGDTGEIHCLAFSPDGKTLATGSEDKAARLFDGASGQLRTSLQGHTDAIWSLVFAPGGGTLATGSYDSTVRLWDVAGRKLRATLSGANGVPYFGGTNKLLAFSPDGGTLATTSADDPTQTLLWEVDSGRRKTTLGGHTDSVNELAFSPDGQTLATGSEDQSARVWEVTSGRAQVLLRGRQDWVTTVALSSDSRMLATVHADGTTRLWEVASGELRTTLKGAGGPGGPVRFSPDGKTLATASDTGGARLWEVSSGQLRATLPDQQGPATAIAFSRDGRVLATAGSNGPVRLWDAASGQLRATLQGQMQSVNTLAFTPDGQILAAGGYDPVAQATVIRLWYAGSGLLRGTLQGFSGFPAILVFAPDGQTLAASGYQGIDLWDITTRQRKATLAGTAGVVTALAFSVDGKLLAARDPWSKLLIWEVVAAKPIPVTDQTPLTPFPAEITHPLSFEDAGVSLLGPYDAQVWGTLQPLPDAPATAIAAPAGTQDAAVIPTTGGEWIATTPEGYFAGSANLEQFIRWNVDGVLSPGAAYWDVFHRPDLVRQALSAWQGPTP